MGPNTTSKIYFGDTEMQEIKELTAEPILDDLIDSSATAMAYKAADREKNIYSLKLALEIFDVQDVGKWSDDMKMDLMTDIFARWAEVQHVGFSWEDRYDGWRKFEFVKYGQKELIAKVCILKLRCDERDNDSFLFKSCILREISEVENKLHLEHWQMCKPIDEMHEFPSDKLHPQAIQAMIKKEFNVPTYIDLDAITEPATYIVKPAPEPKTYLTTCNPYMSKDWMKRFEELVEERAKFNPYIQHFDLDVNSLYPQLESLVKKELETHSPSKSLYKVGKLVSKCMNESIWKAHTDGLDALRYSAEAAKAYADGVAEERKYKDYYYMIPPRCGKSMAMAAVKQFEEDVLKKEESMKSYEGMSANDILREMQDMLNKEIPSFTFDRRDYEWELSADIRARLMHCESWHARTIGGSIQSVFGIEVRPEHYKLNHIKLVRKVKKEENMTPTQIQIHNEEKVREVARKHSGKLYMQYNATRLGLECVIVHDKGYSVEFEIPCSKAMNYDEMHALDHEIGRRFQAERTYRSLLESRPFAKPKVSAYSLPGIDQVIFNDPATIVYWKDGTKTIVQARGEAFDPEKGMAMAIAKKAMGNKREYYHPFLKWLKKYAKKKNPAYPEDFMPKPEKFCRDCDHYNLVEDHPPCNDCIDKSHWEKK